MAGTNFDSTIVTNQRSGKKFIERLGNAVTFGRLTIKTRKGGTYHFVGKEDGPDAELIIKKSGFARKLLTGGDVGFAEAYIEGICDTPDLTALIQLGALNEDVAWANFLKGIPVFRWLARFGHVLRANSRRGAKRNIKSHYDLGNEFYASWLDPSMTYSSAAYPASTASLEKAQEHKYHLLLSKLNVDASHHILEIGCGWGGFAIYAAKTTGCKVTALTISQAQFNYAKLNVSRLGLEGQISIKLCDYRDINEKFDRIVSIEMLEAVGEAYWASYFGKFNSLLAIGGRAAIQVITIDEAYWQSYRRNPDFIQQYIFPGGMLPTIERLKKEVQAAKLNWQSCSKFGTDYARTLRTWRGTFDTKWPYIESLGFDEHFRRMWRYYFCYCEAGFNIGRIDVVHAILSRD